MFRKELKNIFGLNNTLEEKTYKKHKKRKKIAMFSEITKKPEFEQKYDKDGCVSFEQKGIETYCV